MTKDIVFTHHFIEEVKRKYAHTPNHRKPRIYWVSTMKEYEEQRMRIEDLVAMLPPGKRGNVVERIRTKEQYTNTYHELIVGEMLRKLGYTVEYEKPMVEVDELLTPDWYVCKKGHLPPFYVEVFTPNPSKNIIETDNKWQDLCARLEELPIPVGISIQANERCNPPDATRSKKIAEIVREWLQEHSPRKGEVLNIDCNTLEEVTEPYTDYRNSTVITFEISKHSNEDQRKARCTQPIFIRQVLVDALKNNIQRKIRHYGNAVKRENLPFVICLMPHYDSLLGHDSFVDAIWGELVTDLYEDKSGEKIWRDRRLDNGIFSARQSRNETLSAVSWLSKAKSWDAPTGEATIMPYLTYLNPFALYPLSQDALDFSAL
jgi:hypothetical protein